MNIDNDCKDVINGESCNLTNIIIQGNKIHDLKLATHKSEGMSSCPNASLTEIRYVQKCQQSFF